MVRILRQYLLAWVLVAASFVVVAALWSRMPEKVPTHWDAYGNVNGTMSKPWGPLVGPLTALALTAFLSVCPLLSPEKFRMERFMRAWTYLVTAIAGFILVVTVAVSLVGAGTHVDVTRVITMAIGVLFAVIGNFMGKMTPNFFAGIRTPWTLTNEEVWLRTHRLGGKLFVAAGLAALAASFVSSIAGFVTIMAGSLVASIVPVVYSYVIYRRITGGHAA